MALVRPGSEVGEDAVLDSRSELGDVEVEKHAEPQAQHGFVVHQNLELRVSLGGDVVMVQWDDIDRRPWVCGGLVCRRHELVAGTPSREGASAHVQPQQRSCNPGALRSNGVPGKL